LGYRFYFSAMNLAGKRILVGISGSIAAYKAITLVRLLVKAGAEAKVVMTPAATEFVAPLVLSTLSKNTVVHSLAHQGDWANHVQLGRWAHLMVVAPATCNTIAKMAAGMADNLLLAVYLSATCPVMVVPAMDEDMWMHPTTKRNLSTLEGFGNRVLSVGTGELASGLFGAGRMLEPDQILEAIVQQLGQHGVLAGKTAMVTAGPTYENIDPVRFVGNYSSGKMGIEIAHALSLAGARVTLVLGPTNAAVPAGINVVSVQTASQMHDAALALFPTCDIAVMAAAVADYRPADVATDKIKKHDDEIVLRLIKNPDILKACGRIKTARQLLVGFALETQDEALNAQTKLNEKRADFIVLNSLRHAHSGFGTDTNQVTIFSKTDAPEPWPLQSKAAVAHQLVQLLAKHSQTIAAEPS
jgi:phosphopantothenoylcysteine decarboxylase / phosphopantothenate---cysteine ligase